MPTYQTIHISVDIDYLLNQPDLTQTLESTDFHTDAEFRQYLLALKQQGHRFINTYDCDNFDPSTGCLGHINNRD